MDHSTKSELILEIGGAIDSLPDVREEKVAILALQIQIDRYQPDPGEIARRMVEESLQDIIWQGRRPIQN